MRDGPRQICTYSLATGTNGYNRSNHRGLFVGLQISIRESGEVTILDLLGRSTFERESELLQNHLGKLIADGVRKVLLNLKELTQVDSSGVGVIIATYISLKQQGGDLKLLCPCGRVLKVLTIFRLLDVIPTFDDETQALASFRPRGYSATP
jgi:anti-sigma B factor antagonist